MPEKIISIPLIDIIIPPRARIDYGDLSSLMHSISTQGLLNPIILNDSYELCAGGRRLKAHQELGRTEILARIIPDLSAEDSLVIEWIENEGRKDFTWNEDVQLKRKIHESFSSKDLNWKYRDTAKYLGVSLGGFSMDLELAKALDYFPDLAKYSSKGKAREAYKKLLSRAEAITAEENYSENEKKSLSSLFDSLNYSEDSEISSPDFSVSPVISDSELQEKEKEDSVSSSDLSSSSSSLPDFAYEISDFKDIIKQLPDQSIGFAELDPPYAIRFNEVYGQASDIQTAKDFSDWSSEEYISNMKYLFSELYPKMLKDTWVLCWCGKEWWEVTNNLAEEVGFKTQFPGIWMKPGGSSNNLSSVMCSNYETFLLLKKHTATFNVPSFNAAIYHSGVPHSKKYHPTQKPIELYKIFFSALSRPGTLFFSPFAGSGSSMIIAPEFDMKPVGCDKDQKYYYQFLQAMRNYYAR